ncbi:MAG: hypothetical protein WBD03_05685, partial [Thermoplasmata archaeon]
HDHKGWIRGPGLLDRHLSAVHSDPCTAGCLLALASLGIVGMRYPTNRHWRLLRLGIITGRAEAA